MVYLYTCLEKFMKLNPRAKDLTGMQFGSLTAIRPTHVKNRMVFWDFTCICGNTHNARGNTIKYVASKGDKELPSCGCIEMQRKTKHGYRTVKNTHPAYKAFRGILNRCYNPNDKGYVRYGGKGVTVCDEWVGNPQAFVEWSIANGWELGKYIDKDILCDSQCISPKVYSPTTCLWVTQYESCSYNGSNKRGQK